MPVRARPTRRLERWLWTGPIGHFVGGTLDFAEALARYLRERFADSAPAESAPGARALMWRRRLRR